MTRAEWSNVSGEMRLLWPNGKMPQTSVDRWYDDLRSFTKEQVRVAVLALYRSGREWPPNGAQIRAELLTLVIDAPEWVFVRRNLERVCAVGSERLYHAGRWSHPRQEAIERLDPVTRGFLDTVGIGEVVRCLTSDVGGEAQLRDKYLSMIRRLKRVGSLIGLEPAEGLRAIERVTGPKKGPKLLGAVLSDVQNRARRRRRRKSTQREEPNE
jgi:hypothetical protein